MNFRRFFWTTALLLTLATSSAVRAADSPWTVEDLLSTEATVAWAVSPDGESVAWVRTTVEEVEGEEKAVANLWLSRLKRDESFALTWGQERVSAPAFSPDGRTLAFLFDRKIPAKGKKKEELGEQQIWVLSMLGGEARPVTRFDRPVRQFAWQDSETLIAVAQESASSWEQERKEEKDTAVIVDDLDHEPPVRLFRVPLSGPAQRLTDNGDRIESLAVSPDGRRAVVTAAQDLKFEFDQKIPPKTFLVDLENGGLAQILGEGNLLPQDFAWAPDGSGFYFTNAYTRHPMYRNATITELHFFPLKEVQSRPVELDWPRGLGGGFAPTADGAMVLLANGVRDRPAVLTRKGQGWSRQDLDGAPEGHVDRLQASPNGKTIAVRYSKATQAPQLYGGRLEGATLVAGRALTDLNPSFAEKPTGRVEVVHWPGANGDSVEGLLHYPLGWKEGDAPAPLIVDIHGGPTGTDQDRWDQSWSGPNLLFRQRGAFVLQVNYHGSAGYGLDWAESIAGRYYEQETVDIQSGIDHVIALGLVDPARLGCTGWSNGGILTAELITRTDRFKAASVGAADVEWLSDWANVDFGAAFDNYYFGGPPWEKTAHYIEKSPFFRLSEVTTPTIIYTGTEDRNVPPHQSWSLYRALQFMDKEARLVIFPGEPHGLRKVAHQRRKVEEELAWFDRYLFATLEPTNEAIQDDSPLAALLARAQASRVGEALGVDHRGSLIPETTPWEGLELGRFEVTRGQFAAFDRKFQVKPGTENYPATGIPFEQAQRYAAWLAQRTGRPFRLPTVAEATAWAEEAGDEGNTLDQWAGYSPNPDDVRRLHEAAAKLGGKAPLLQEVGLHPGISDIPVFDLDGNAAEWAVGEDGKPPAIGPSADRPADSRSTEATTDPAYIGFRVVVSAAEK